MLSRVLPRAARLSSRWLATSAAPSASEPAVSYGSLKSLSNIEASFKHLSPEEQQVVYDRLGKLQEKDWPQLSLDEKKACYYVAFGEYGPREPIVPPGSNIKVFAGTVAAVVAGIAVFALIRTQAAAPPRTMTKEWQEAAQKYAQEQKMDPFTGAARPDGKGHKYA